MSKKQETTTATARRAGIAAVVAAMALSLAAVLFFVIGRSSSSESKNDTSTEVAATGSVERSTASGPIARESAKSHAAAKRSMPPMLDQTRVGALRIREIAWLPADKREATAKVLFDAMQRILAETDALIASMEHSMVDFDSERANVELRADLAEILSSTEVDQVMEEIGGHAFGLMAYKAARKPEVMTKEEHQRRIDEWKKKNDAG